jgi:hypothetical protein
MEYINFLIFLHLRAFGLLYLQNSVGLVGPTMLDRVNESPPPHKAVAKNDTLKYLHIW